jgi:inosine-uridine nucleoside N-ribohydrolase
MRKFFLFALLLFSFSVQVFAHSGKPKYHVIIDTDGAVDDMRSLSMFLAGNDIRVLAITCSQGTLMPYSVFKKVKSLISAFHHEGIPVGIGRSTDFKLPDWSSFAQNIKWGNETSFNADSAISSSELLDNVTAGYKDKIVLIALGSLKTYADWIKENPSIAGKIERIIWYNNHKIEEGFNYKASTESYEFVKQSGILLEIVSATINSLSVNNNYIGQLQDCNSVYAQQIVKVHNQTIVKEKISQNHLKLWDDLVPLYMTVPLLFETKLGKQR